MVRFSVSLDEDQNEWVEERAEQLNGSKAQVIKMLVDAGRDGALDIDQSFDAQTAGSSGGFEARLVALEERLQAIEEQVGPESAPQQSPGEEATAEQDDSGSDRQLAGSERSEQEPAPGSSGVIEAPPGSERGSDAEDARRSSSMGSVSDTDVDAVQEFVQRQANELATPTEITNCWQLLKTRGTASPKVFKKQCFSGEPSSEAELDQWFDDGVAPVLEKLPGVEPPENEGRFYRYRY